MRSHFDLFNAAPVVYVNVLDPTKSEHIKEQTSQTIQAYKEGRWCIEKEGILLNSLILILPGTSQHLQPDIDYKAAFDVKGFVQISSLAKGAIPHDQKTLVADYHMLNPAGVEALDILGGIDPDGNMKGLEVLNRVFPKFGLVPGMVLAPKFSTVPFVAATMAAKASNINECFKAITAVDISTKDVQKYQDAPEWKNKNNYTSERQIVCWPKVKLGEKEFHLSTQISGVCSRTDALNDDVPHTSPSNKKLQVNGACLAGMVKDDITLGPEQANYLNSQGIVTALNYIGGFKAWGNSTGAFPANTDVKDRFIACRRMADWISNTIILTFWNKVDSPINMRLIDTLIDSINSWFNGLANEEKILGGRCEIIKKENPTTSLLDGKLKFYIYYATNVPGEEIDFVLEYDPKYFDKLFK